MFLDFGLFKFLKSQRQKFAEFLNWKVVNYLVVVKMKVNVLESRLNTVYPRTVGGDYSPEYDTLIKTRH